MVVDKARSIVPTKEQVKKFLFENPAVTAV
jgi:hypothetical protein